ncbi:redoxin domain-containing protein [Chitinophaga rhizophila]|uniref:AhpC/TSA family protein n=1 Tax=Chitinophaga rhizophila TaxID=2866212 RepID=A0ABS7GCW6_9BACT|nr:TlpA disulfide reductase family protein [Chitinophaga rhizophila]MBW8684512.1 AhpC/TSA family protein [Chitinophaga rhizophila]
MKKALLLTAALIPMLAVAQSKKFTITGKIGSLNAPARVYFDWTDFQNAGGGKEDSADVVNGTFKFTGEMSGVATCRMALAHHGDGKMKAVYTGDVIYFNFGKENITITSKDSLSNAVFKGSKIHAEEDAYNKEIGGTVMAITKQANVDFSAGTAEQRADTNFIKTIDQRFRKRMHDRTAAQLKYAKEHPNSIFGLIALSEAINASRDMDQIIAAYEGLNPQFRNSKKGQELDKRIKSVKLTTPGAEAPDFTMNDVNGKPVSLKDLRGKLVLLEFWASWCGPCRAENPNLREQYKMYKDKGFEILGVSLDSDKGKWVDAIAKDGIPWIHVSDLKGWSNEAGILYGVSGVPAGFLIGPDGKVVGNNLRGESLNKKLAELLNQ